MRLNFDLLDWLKIFIDEVENRQVKKKEEWSHSLYIGLNKAVLMEALLIHKTTDITSALSADIFSL